MHNSGRNYSSRGLPLQSPAQHSQIPMHSGTMTPSMPSQMAGSSGAAHFIPDISSRYDIFGGRTELLRDTRQELAAREEDYQKREKIILEHMAEHPGAFRPEFIYGKAPDVIQTSDGRLKHVSSGSPYRGPHNPFRVPTYRVEQYDAFANSSRNRALPKRKAPRKLTFGSPSAGGKKGKNGGLSGVSLPYKSSHDNMMAEKQMVYEQLTHCEQIMQDYWAWEKIQAQGGCPAGFKWMRMEGGYVCYAENHCISDINLVKGRGLQNPGEALNQAMKTFGMDRNPPVPKPRGIQRVLGWIG